MRHKQFRNCYLHPYYFCAIIMPSRLTSTASITFEIHPTDLGISVKTLYAVSNNLDNAERAAPMGCPYCVKHCGKTRAVNRGREHPALRH